MSAVKAKSASYWVSGLAVSLLVVLLVSLPGPVRAGDQLPSWHDGDARETILEFVAAVTDAKGADYVPVRERIAVFDNDGTLLVEEPWPVAFEFIFYRIRELSAEHPEWRNEQPFKAVLENDRAWLRANNRQAVRELSATAQAGLSPEEYEAEVRSFLADEPHPDSGKLHTRMVYQPMLELISLLRRHEFRVYVVSGGETDFIRAFADEIYGIPRENVIGSRVTYRVVSDNGSVSLLRRAQIDSVNVGGFKVVNIHNHIGRRPVFVAGNSDGDLAMLQYPDKPAALRLLLVHDDKEREYEVEQGNERARELAEAREWLLVSMQDDFRQVYPQ